MNSEDFIAAIKEVVRDPAIEDTLEVVANPPGRKVPEHERARSQWFNELSKEDKLKIESIVADSIDEALFGLFCVLDGVRSVSDEEDKLVLIHRDLKDEVLNDPEKIGLHSLYNAKN